MSEPSGQRTRGDSGPLTGRTAVVTGASSGIGAAAARQLADLGANLIVLGRSPEGTAATAAQVGGQPVTVDFARLADVRRAAADVAALSPRIDLLLNNAGGIFPGPVTTEDGHELTVQVNHLAPFLLTHLLLPRLAATPGSRVVVTSSVVNATGRIDLANLSRPRRLAGSYRAYSTSKLMNILFVRELARRAGATGPTAVAVHPGLILTRLGRDARYIRTLYWPPLRLARSATSPDNGARPLVAAATRPDPHAVNGAYLHRFIHRDRLLTSPQAHDPDLARGLWDVSAQLVGLAD
jgi:NAD(P)-dependent dehydrogenase (short-subunit alcohol dehydrogenase family)